MLIATNRTPLTSIKVEAETLMQVGDTDRRADKTRHERYNQQASRLSGMVERAA